MRRPRLSEISAALAVTLLVGCAHLGWRPPPPAWGTNACDNFKAYYDYADGLKTAWGSRAALNRYAIYGAGVLLLGTVAATAGLGAAAAASLSIALISVSGTFVSGTFALVNNPALADAYTTAENAVGDALLVARSADTSTPLGCSQALKDLDTAVTKAIKDIEVARTAAADVASGVVLNKVIPTAVAVAVQTQLANPTPAATSTP